MSPSPHAAAAGQAAPDPERSEPPSAVPADEGSGQIPPPGELHSNDLAASPQRPLHERKAFANLQAVAALAGFTVEAIEADDGTTEYCVSRWAYTRRCRSLQELAAALRSMGVVAAQAQCEGPAA
jgi:hypothetical protein